MAQSVSAKKRIRQNVKRRAHNRRRKGLVKNAVRELNDSLQGEKAGNPAELLKTVYKQLDRSAAKGAIHKKTAARKKSHLAKRLAAAGK